MIGYIERMFNTLAGSKHPSRSVPGQTVNYELRQAASQGNGIPYIAVFNTDALGHVVSDLLLTYDDEMIAREDWEKLIGPEVVKLSELRFVNRIVDHHVGYGRNGSVTMY